MIHDYFEKKMKLYNALAQEESKIHEHTTQLTIIDSSFFLVSATMLTFVVNYSFSGNTTQLITLLY